MLHFQLDLASQPPPLLFRHPVSFPPKAQAPREKDKDNVPRKKKKKRIHFNPLHFVNSKFVLLLVQALRRGPGESWTILYVSQREH